MKSIVIFYSLEGNTELIAKAISEKTNADILELKPVKEYHKTGFKKFFWGGKSVVFNEKPELISYDKNLDMYDNIFIGTPIWVGTYAPPFNTFFNDIKLENKNIYLFACHGGGGADKFYDNVKKKIPNNKFIDSIDFCDPIEKNTQESLNRVYQWLRDNNLSLNK